MGGVNFLNQDQYYQKYFIIISLLQYIMNNMSNNNTQNITIHHQTKWSEKLRSRLSYTAFGLIHTNTTGIAMFAFFGATEYLIMAFLLVISSTPPGYVNDSKYFEQIQIFELPENDNIIISIGFGISALSILMWLVFLNLLSSNSAFDKAREPNMMKMIFGLYIQALRSVSVYLFAFEVTYFVLYLKRENNSTYTYAAITIQFIVVIFRLIMTFFAFFTFTLIIPCRQLPWASLQTNNTWLKSIFKIVLVCQCSYLDYVRQNRAGMICYYLVLITVMTIISFYEPQYHNQKANRLQHVFKFLTLGIGYICLIRVLFQSPLLETFIYFPFVIYSLYKVDGMLNSQINTKLLHCLENGKTMTPGQLMQSIQLVLLLIERQNDDDQIALQRLLYNHQVQCDENACVCNAYHDYVIQPFVKKVSEENQTPLKVQVKQIEESSGSSQGSEEVEKVDKEFYNEDEIEQLQEAFPDTNGMNYIHQMLQSPSKTFGDRVLLFFYYFFIYQNISKIVQSPSIRKTDTMVGGYSMMNEIGHQSLTAKTEVLDGIFVNNFFIDIYENERIYQRQLQQMPNSNGGIGFIVYNFKIQSEARRQFFIELLEKIFCKAVKDIDQRIMSTAIDCQLLNIYFTTNYLSKHFLGAFQLLRLKMQNMVSLGFRDKLRFSICELYIIDSCSEYLKSSLGEIDYAGFIDKYNDQSNLDNMYEQTTNDVIDFWYKWSRDELSMSRFFIDGAIIAQNVDKIQKQNKVFEKSIYFKKSLPKYHTYALFFLNVLQDSSSYYQMIDVIKNAMIFKVANQQIKIRGENQIDQFDLNAQADLGMAIVKAWKNQSGKWEFLYANKIFCEILNFKETFIIGKDIKYMMPIKVAKYHDQFVQKFYNDGVPKFVGKQRVLFAKDFHGFIVPISFRLNFFYSPQFSYTFVAQIDKARLFNLHHEEQSRIQVKDAVIFICDSNLVVTDYSETLVRYCFQQSDQAINQDELKVKALRLGVFLQGIEDILKTEFGQNIFPQTSQQSIVNKTIMLNLYTDQSQGSDNLEHPSSQVESIMTYFQQNYVIQNDVITEHIFIVLPIQKHPNYEEYQADSYQRQRPAQLGVISPSIASMNFDQKATSAVRLSGQNTLTPQSASSPKKSQIFQGLSSHQSMDSQTLDEFDVNSVSATSNTEIRNATSLLAKNLLFNTKTPKILKMSLFFLGGYFVLFLTSSLINLVLFMNNDSDFDQGLKGISILQQGNIYLNTMIIGFKMGQILSLNQTLQNSSSTVIQDVSRVGFYYDIQKQYSLQIENLSYSFHQLYNHQNEVDKLIYLEGDIQRISNNGTIFQTLTTYEDSIYLLGGAADQISLDQLKAEKYFINKGSVANRTAQQYTFNQVEKNLFYIYMNGQYNMHELGAKAKYQMINLIKSKFANLKKILKFSTFISIGVLAFLGVFLIPLIAKVNEKKIHVIKFFDMVDQKIVFRILKTAQEFEKLYQKQRAAENNTSLVRYPANQKMIADNVSNNANHFGSIQKQRESFKIKSHNNLEAIPEEQNYNIKRGRNKSKLQQKKIIVSAFDVQASGRRMLPGSAREEIKDQSYSDDLSSSLDQISGRSYNYKERAGAQGGAGKPSSKELSKQQEVKEQNEDEKDESNNEDAIGKPFGDDMIHKSVLLSQLCNLKVRQYIKVLVPIFLLLMLFNAYLILSFFQQNSIFELNNNAMDTLNLFYRRQIYSQHIMNYNLESLILNKTILVNTTSFDTGRQSQVDAVKYFLDQSIMIENDITSTRQINNEYFNDIVSIIEGFEQDIACNVTFAYDPKLLNICYTTQNGVIKTGMTNVMYYMINYAQALYISFNQTAGSQKTASWLSAQYSSRKFQEIIDMQNYILRHIHQYCQTNIREHTSLFFEKKRSQYMGMFGGFMCATLIANLLFMVIFFKKTKRQIQDAKNTLVMLPLEDMEVDERLKILAYLQE